MRRAAAAGFAALTLAGCASLPPPKSPFSNLPGWSEEDHAAALAAYRAGCSVVREPAAMVVCAKARALGGAGEGAARAFFETNFRPEPVAGTGLLTGYFAPEYPARAASDPEFSAPVRARPADPALARAERSVVEAEPAPDALAWMRPEDLFFLQIQGSGVLNFPDGRRARAAYAGDNGQPFVPIARSFVQRGLLPPDGVSAEAIRGWLAAHRGPEAQALMDLNPRYIFFRMEPDDGREPQGAAGVPLVPGRSVAIDPAFHAYGELLWLDASEPTLAGAVPAYRRLALALDTGAAIKGEARADLYLGRGAQAGLEAGRVRHTLHLVRLVPVERAATGTPRDETAAAPR